MSNFTTRELPYPSVTKMLPAASNPTSVGRLNTYGSGGGRRRSGRGRGDALDRFGPPADHHHDPSLGVELDDHVRPLVDRPDVVVAIDPHGVRELEPVQPLAELAHERAGPIELEQPGVAAARVDEHVPLRIGRHADAFAQMKGRRELQEVRDRVVRDLGHVLRFRFALGEHRRDPRASAAIREAQRDCDEAACDRAVHPAPPAPIIRRPADLHPPSRAVRRGRPMVTSTDRPAYRTSRSAGLQACRHGGKLEAGSSGSCKRKLKREAGSGQLTLHERFRWIHPFSAGASSFSGRHSARRWR